MTLFRSSAGLTFNDLIKYPKLNFEEGAFSFITGKSGCGKSSYLKMLNRTVVPAAGSIYYRERDITEYPVREYRRRVMLVPQDVCLIDGSVKDNFNFYADARGATQSNSRDMMKYLKLCCSDADPDTYCSELSGGEKQRVFLAIFMSFMPETLLLDEPTAALDEKTSVELLGNIKETCSEYGIAAICVCHNEEIVRRFSDMTVRLGEEL